MFLPFPTKCWKNNEELRYARIWKCVHWSYFGNEETSGSEEVFDQAFQDHIKIWKELPNGEKFCKYLSDLSVTMKESMTANVCVKAGLGNPTEVLHQWQNNNERIKHKMDRREAGLCSFVAEMKQLAYSQETEFAKSLCGMSTEYKVRNLFSSFCVPTEKWYDTREDQRQPHVQRVYKLVMSEMYAANRQHCVLVCCSDVQLPTPHQNLVTLEVLSLYQC